jgi:hypothetical protein
MLAACTIVSRNYLHFARTLCASFLAAHPGATFYVLLVDRPSADEDLGKEPFTVIWVEELGIPNFLSIAFKYDILELNTNVKPTFLKWILNKYGAERLIYLDPDIFVYSNLGEIDNRLHEADIILTPHILSPIHDNKRPEERDFLLGGVFNLGFIGISNRGPVRKFLDWWETRCLDSGFNEQRSGLFVDQKWVNFVPCFFDNIEILRDPGYNVAYWNLHERLIEKKDDRFLVNRSCDLKFFHFSGIDFANINRISKYQNRFTLLDRGDLLPLFEGYRREILKNGLSGETKTRYAFGFFSNGDRITGLARRVYSISSDKLGGHDPFDANDAMYSFAKRNRLLSNFSIDNNDSHNSFNVDPDDFRLRFIYACLRLARLILGADRYTLLMRYLGHISILRNQRPLYWQD